VDVAVGDAAGLFEVLGGGIDIGVTDPILTVLVDVNLDGADTRLEDAITDMELLGLFGHFCTPVIWGSLDG
jgi:hypothetical protein